MTKTDEFSFCSFAIMFMIKKKKVERVSLLTKNYEKKIPEHKFPFSRMFNKTRTAWTSRGMALFETKESSLFATKLQDKFEDDTVDLIVP